MSIISVSKINKSYGVTAALTDVSFHVNKGDRIGIVGANGAGKSTLMKILTGELTADSGSIFYDRDLTSGYLKQMDHFPGGGTVLEEMERLFTWQSKTEKELDRLLDAGDYEAYHELSERFAENRGYTYKSEIRGILSSLAFSEEDLEKPVDVLSGGERTRLALAALLLQDPDLLFLDEPTNHLDIGTLKWLEQYLRAYKGTLIVISHDRYFLDKIATRIFEIEATRLTVYEGNYSQYAEKKRLLYEEQLKHYEQAKKERERQEEIIRRFKQHGTEHLVKRAQSREKKLAREELPDKPQQYNERIRLRFDEKLESGNDVFFAKDLAVSVGEGSERRELFEGVDMDIKKGDRICLVGPNGIGKTTLLKVILGQMRPDSGSLRYGQNVLIGYYDQEQKLLDPEKTVLDEVHSAYIKYDQTELRGLLGRFLFHGDDVFKKVADLAGGERARLSLLKLMMSGSNFLILDEPTNHLDIRAKEAFEDALLEFPGTLLIVSHDRYLLKRIPTAIYELGPDGIDVYLGGYDYYEEKSSSIASGRAYLNEMGRRAAAQDAPISASDASAARGATKEERIAAREAEKAAAAAQRKKERKLAEAEQAAEEADAKVAEIEEQLCKPEVFSDREKAAALSAELEEAKKTRDAAYDAWMALQE